jgi:hypothetical protein
MSRPFWRYIATRWINLSHKSSSSVLNHPLSSNTVFDGGIIVGCPPIQHANSYAVCSPFQGHQRHPCFELRLVLLPLCNSQRLLSGPEQILFMVNGSVKQQSHDNGRNF